MQNHNLTPHSVIIADEHGESMEFKPSGIVARMESKDRERMGYVPFAHPDAEGGIHNGVEVPAMGAMSPPKFKGLDPESIKGFSPADGDLIIVSLFCGEEAAKTWPSCWVVSPDTSPGRCERDEKGMITCSYNWVLWCRPQV